MQRLSRRLGVSVAALVAVSGLFFVVQRSITAADHLDPPARTDPAVDPRPDAPADIADLFAFHDATNFVAILTFAGPASTSLPAVYDPNVLYRINISNAGSRADAEIVIEMRFGFDGPQPGIQVTGLPGSGPIVGPVERDLSQNGYLIRAGLFDEPFFFDLQGFRDTRSSGTLMFNSNRNFFAGQNITAVVLQIPRSRIENGTNKIDIWTDTSRFGGQL